jgi:hypothetical protein
MPAVKTDELPPRKAKIRYLLAEFVDRGVLAVVDAN